MDEGFICLGIAPTQTAERLKSKLQKENVELKYFYNKKSCGSGGCSLNVELWVRESDIDAVKKVFIAESQRDFSGLVFDPETVNQVFDPEKKIATCPACGHEFATSLKECPDCGLCFDVPPEA